MTDDIDTIEIPPVGTVFKCDSITVTEQMIIDYARQYDPQLMHVDPIGAANSPFKRLIASGQYVGALTTRLMVEAQPLGKVLLIGLGIDKARFLQPVFPGDTLSVSCKIHSIREYELLEDEKIIYLYLTTSNQHDELVFRVLMSIKPVKIA